MEVSLAERLQVFSDPRVAKAFEELSAQGTGDENLPMVQAAVRDPRAFLERLGVRIPDGMIISLEVPDDVMEESPIGPMCVGPWCLCYEQCEEEHGKKHCWKLCM
jgi:hypothetical protein